MVIDTSIASLDSSSVARLDSGLSVVAWAKDGRLYAQRLDASGSRLGEVIRISEEVALGNSPSSFFPAHSFSVAPLSGDEWIATWAATEAGSAGVTIRLQRFSATGEPIGEPTQVSQVHEKTSAPLAVRRTADGGFVIGWAAFSSQAASRAYVARFDRNGASVVAAPVPVSGLPGDQDEVSLGPLSDGTVVVGWRQLDGAGASGYTRSFNPSGQTAEVEREVLAWPGRAESLLFTTASLPGNKVVVAWSAGTPPVVYWRLPDGTQGSVSVSGWSDVDGLNIVDAGGGNFDLVFQVAVGTTNSSSRQVMAQRVNANGVAQGEPVVAVPVRKIGGYYLAPASPHFSVAGNGDGHYILSYQTSTEPSADAEVRALAR